VADLLACFGPRRLLWGSDWPVLDLAADYGRWLAACEALLDHLDNDERAAVFGLNACRIYRLTL
jgi:L-fuconolactonase